MAEVSRQSCGRESPAGDPGDFRRVDATAVKMSISDGFMESRTARCSSADISLKMDDACRAPSPSNPKIQVHTSPSPKGWFLREGKAQQQDDVSFKSHKGSGSDGNCCRCVVVPISACQQSSVVERKMKRSWLDSRKLFLIFASLSSMGTVMLIYLTLSMGTIDGRRGRNGR